MIIQHDKSSLPVGESVRDGDFDARLLKVFVTAANQDVALWHKMGRTPRQVQIVWKDGFLDFKVSLDGRGQPVADTEKIVLQFSAANVTAVLRFA